MVYFSRAPSTEFPLFLLQYESPLLDALIAPNPAERFDCNKIIAHNKMLKIIKITVNTIPIVLIVVPPVCLCLFHAKLHETLMLVFYHILSHQAISILKELNFPSYGNCAKID